MCTQANKNITRSDEQQRLQALYRYHVLDTEAEPQFDDLVQLAATLCETPIAMISLLDAQREWFKASVGLDVPELPRAIAFCDAVVAAGSALVVTDALSDPRFESNPLVIGEPGVRFYAGVPLLAPEGHAIGTLAVIDRVPRDLSLTQARMLQVLAREVLAQLELRRTVGRLQTLLAEGERTQSALQDAHGALEQKVAERTDALRDANRTLAGEAERTRRAAALSQAIIDSLPGIVCVLDGEGRILRWNRNFEIVSGRDAEEIARANVTDFCANQHEHAQLMSRIAEALDGTSIAFESDLATRTGVCIPYLFTGARIELEGRPCVCCMGMDITARRQAEASLRLRDRALQASVNAIIITDLEGKIAYANPAFERMTGYKPEEFMGQNCRFLQGEDTGQPGIAAIRNIISRCEEGGALLRNYRKTGELFWNDLHIAPVGRPDGTVTHYVGVLNDITAIKHYESELERHVNVDLLTALPNRKVLHERLRSALATAQRLDAAVTVGFIDLDNFKFINDSLGHNIGDELLKGVAERLLVCLRTEDTLARYGGDEFAFVLLGHKGEPAVATLMDRILKAVDQPFAVGGHTFFISCSIGLSVYPRDGADVDTLLKNADAAMHLAKERGRNNFQFYTPAMNRRVSERLAMESKLRQALANDEFALYYQPKVDLRRGAVAGIEALLRWFPRGARTEESIPPATFIPLAEEIGLINPIGEWAINTACAHNRAMQDMGLPALRTAVNISARQFEPKTVVVLVREALLGAGLDGRFLELELTESMVMRNPEEAISVLLDLKEMGLRLAIDDFGTGYSSLSYLQRFPVDALKIDQSFVHNIGVDPNNAIIARTVISLGHNLGMRVIAEGVSTSEQLSFLQEYDCDEMQGYLFSEPLPLPALIRFMREHGRPDALQT